MNAPELSPEEQDIVARFDAAPTLPEDAEAALIESTAAALAEDANAGAVFDPIDLDPELYGVYEEDREFFRGQARAALAVFRGQQDPAVQRVLELADEMDDEADSMDSVANSWDRVGHQDTDGNRCRAKADQYRTDADRIRAAIGGDGR